MKLDGCNTYLSVTNRGKRLVSIFFLLGLALLNSGCVNVIARSVEDVPAEYQADYLHMIQIKLGMSRKDSYKILGDPGIDGTPLKVRWKVYEDDPAGCIEIIYWDEKVVKATFARFADPSFGFSIK